MNVWIESDLVKNPEYTAAILIATYHNLTIDTISITDNKRCR